MTPSLITPGRPRLRRFAKAEGGGGGGDLAYLSGLADDTWREVSGTRMDTAMTFTPAFGKNVLNILAYTGACMCGPEMVITGGGHTDYAGNEVMGIFWNVDAPAWYVRKLPTAQALINPDTYYNDDGSPNSSHRYWELQYNPVDHHLLLVGTGSIYENGGAGPQTDAYDLNTDSWLAAGTYPSNPGGPFSNLPDTPHCADSNGDIWVRSDSGELRRLNVATKTWTSKGGSIARSGGPSPSVHDSIRNRLINIGPFACVQTGLSGSSAVSESSITFGGSQASIGSAGGSTIFIPALDRVLIKPFTSNSIYQMDSSFNIEPYSVAGTPPPSPAADGREDHGYGRFNYYPAERLVIWVQATNRNAFVFRHPEA